MKPLHILMSIAVTFIWGAHYAVAKVGMAEIPPFLFGLLRYFFAVFPLIFWVKKPEGLSWKVIIPLSLLMSVVSTSLLLFGIKSGISSGLASIVAQTQVIFTVILSRIYFKSRLSALQIIGICVALFGIFIISAEQEISIEEASFMGIFFILMGAFAWAISNTFFRYIKQPKPFNFVIWMGIVPPLPFFLLSLTFEGPDLMLQSLSHMTGAGIFAIAFSIICSTWIATPLWVRLFKTYDPAVIAPYSLMIPVFGMSLSYFALGEVYTPLSIAGCVCIFLGLVLNQWKSAQN